MQLFSIFPVCAPIFNWMNSSVPLPVGDRTRIARLEVDDNRQIEHAFAAHLALNFKKYDVDFSVEMGKQWAESFGMRQCYFRLH